MKEIIVFFRNHCPVTYSAGILELLKTDNNVTEIIDAETGEIIFSR